MCNNDVIIEVKLKDEQGKAYSKYITGDLLLIYANEIIIFADVTDMEGTKYPLSLTESIGVVGRYDEKGKECQHYSIIADKL
jgi:hypothetical protein